MKHTNDKSATRLPFDGPHVAVPKSYLEAIVRNGNVPLKERFDAFLMLTSWGNHCEFACQDWEFGGRLPMTQVDIAAALNVTKQRISEIVKLRRSQGLLKAGTGKRLEPSVHGKKEPDE